MAISRITPGMIWSAHFCHEEAAFFFSKDVLKVGVRSYHVGGELAVCTYKVDCSKLCVVVPVSQLL